MPHARRAWTLLPIAAHLRCPSPGSAIAAALPSEAASLVMTDGRVGRKWGFIGGAVGGIRSQLLNGVTGFLVHSPEGAANRAVELLGNPNLRDALGDAGHDHVKENFLTTRHIRDYLLLMLAMEHGDTDLSVLTASSPR